jgi:hypothetical protein
MWGVTKVGWIRAVALLGGATGLLALSGCGGGDDFENKPRPPAPIQLSGVITDSSVSVEPRRVGAGPVVLLVSNQTQRSHTVTLEGPTTREQIGPINPLGVGRIQETLEPGKYQVKAGSEPARPGEIKPAQLTVGPSRGSSSNDVLLP